MTFPTARRTRDGWVYCGRHFKSRDEVVDAMSDRDYRRSVDWETSTSLCRTDCVTLPR